MTHMVYYFIMIFSLGQWEIPIVTSTRPPPCAYFTSNTLPGNRGVMFGGIVVDETGKHRVNDLFLFTCLRDTIVSCENLYSVFIINKLPILIQIFIILDFLK